MKEQRIAYWDNIKFFLILFVVIGHFATQYTDGSGFYKALFIGIYTFHMPLFLFVSGVFHNNNRIVQRVIKYLLYYFILKFFLALATFLIFKKEINISFFTESGLPWFMLTLAFHSFLTYLLRNMNIRLVLVFSVIIACIAGYDASIGDFLALSRTIVYYPFYLAGFMLSDRKLERLTERKFLKVAGGIFLLAFIAFCFWGMDTIYVLRPLFTGRNSYSVFGGSFGALYRLLCYLITALVSFAILAVIPHREIKIISAFGRRTLQVYTWHYIAVYLLTTFPFTETLAVYSGVWGKLAYILEAVCITGLFSLKVFQYPSKFVFNQRWSG